MPRISLEMFATGLLEKVPGFRNRSFPLPVVMQLVGLFDLATGVGIGAATGPFRSSERNLCRKLWKHVRTGDAIMADSGFAGKWSCSSTT